MVLKYSYFLLLAPGNLHEKLKGLFTSRSERRFKSNGMKNTLLSSRRTINNEELGKDKLGEGNGVLKEIIEDHMTIAKKPATLHKEIADKLELPLGTVKSRIFFARKELKRQIKGQYGNYTTIRSKLSA